jgi:hypothetical protein
MGKIRLATLHASAGATDPSAPIVLTAATHRRSPNWPALDVLLLDDFLIRPDACPWLDTTFSHSLKTLVAIGFGG